MIKKAAAILKGAKNIVILCGRTSRSVDAWNERVAFAEGLNAKVITELKIGASFPTDHPLMAAVPAGSAIPPDAQAAVKAADVIVNLDWVDLAGVFKVTFGDEPPKAKVHLDHQRLPHPPRLEHGLPGPAGGRRAAAGDAG